jgi:hypothetical protein
LTSDLVRGSFWKVLFVLQRKTVSFGAQVVLLGVGLFRI